MIGGSTVLWPLIFITEHMLRFPGTQVDYFGALIFVPMGAIAGGLLAYLLSKAPAGPHKLLILLGYLIACPIAFLGALGGGLFLSPLVGATLIGAFPLALGSWLGYLLGRRFSEEQS